MNPHVWWYLARASGIVAALLVTVAVVWGLLLSTRVLRGAPRPAWLLDLHRMLGGLSVAFVVVHLVALVADSNEHFGAADVLVPFASGWRPAAVAFGVLAMYLLIAVELTSLAMRRLPRKWWHGVHLSSYVCFWFVVLHGALAGTDAANPLYRWGSLVAVVAVAGLTLYRVVVGRRARRRSRPVPRSPQVRQQADQVGPQPGELVTVDRRQGPQGRPTGVGEREPVLAGVGRVGYPAHEPEALGPGHELDG